MTAARDRARVVVDDTPADVARRVAEHVTMHLRETTTAGRTFHMCLTGGSMGGAVLREVAAHPAVADIHWNLVHVWWGDERFVARDHADRNSLQSRHSLLDHVPLPAENIHEVAEPASDLSLDEAAAAYAAELAGFGNDDQRWPSFDVCFLGMGPDGHIASLFPEREEVQETDAAALPIRNSPKPPPERVTLTLPVLNASSRVWLVITGADKAPALGLAVAGASTHQVPAAGVLGRTETIFFVDAAAAAEIAPDLIERAY